MSRTQIAFALLALAPPLSIARADDAPEKCKIATKGDSPIVKACAAGGQKEAAKTMKAMVKEAKLKGVQYRCDGCHEDMTSYNLKDSAREDFKKLLAAVK